ncbi:hypothetical protein AVM11_08805 [Sphingomonas melonis TY]|uniref:Gene transfer agent family protein n=1 Tax=Sphingomonas melonis TY TaxID=621456 RepID=A0A175Y025_9SPHN|nr:hypothetical protein [Sphingomonas melonis]AOW22232.1 hypothetical protein BJP26_00575 [Sphingomonas melonis TY]KZB94094.1 hypothetical protein AVM11_08805 [Sphingomonas melonis TY]
MVSANSQRGQLGFEVDIEGQREPQRWTMSFGTNALCAIEDTFQLTDITGLEGILKSNPSLRTIRTLFRLGLTDCHPDMTDMEAGLLIDRIGGLEPSLELVSRAIEQAFPEAAGSGAGGPRKPTATSGRGTGGRSTRPGARSGETQTSSGG